MVVNGHQSVALGRVLDVNAPVAAILDPMETDGLTVADRRRLADERRAAVDGALQAADRRR